MLNHQPIEGIHPSRTRLTRAAKMKYFQACILKKQVDGSIDKLAKTLTGPNPTDAARVRLAVAHASTFNESLHRLIRLQANLWELEARASTMAWDWDADNIDPNDDDGKLWVPVTAQTLKTGPAEEDRGNPPADPATPVRQMTVYAVQENEDRSAEQASKPIVMPILTPQMKGQVVIKANLG